MAKMLNNKKIALTGVIVIGLAGLGMLTVRLFRKRAEKKAKKI